MYFFGVTDHAGFKLYNYYIHYFLSQETFEKMKQLELAVIFITLFFETTGRVILSNAPRCMVRGGREYVIVFQKPTELYSKDIGNDLYLEWSANGITKRGSESCWYSSDSDQITCPTSWSLFNRQIMRSSIQVKVINTRNQQIVWKHPTAFQPKKHLFDCLGNINIRDLKLFESSATNKWILSWKPFYLSIQLYRPRFQVTIDSINFNRTINIQQCNHRKTKECQIELPDGIRGKSVKLCVKSIFTLDAKSNYHTTGTKNITHCTVTSFSSIYRLKVINMKTGQEVVDYGLWHHPQGDEKLNSTTLLKIRKTKKKVHNVWRRLNAG